MEFIVVGVVALIVGFTLGSKSIVGTVVAAFGRVSRTHAIDRANFLETLRRELANILIWRNPQRYLELYKELHAEVTSFKSWKPEAIRQQLAELSAKYPNYVDFDAVGTREYVLYADGISTMDNMEIETRYRDIVRFEALSTIGDKNWKEASGFVHTTDEKEIEHLTKYAQQVSDTQLHLRLDRALDETKMEEVDNDFYSVRSLPHFAENRLGIHLKKTNEFGIYSYFTHDDGRTSDNHYRSDPTFQEEQHLDVLHAVVNELTPER